MKVSKLAINSINELKQTIFGQQLNQKRQAEQPISYQIAQLQSLREEVLAKLKNLKELSSYLASKQKQQVVEDLNVDQSESQLWSGIDGVQYNIIDCRDEKVYLNSVLEDYEDELFEQERVIGHKRAIDNQLKLSIQAKRMQLEKTRCGSTQNSLSNSIASLSIRSPRMFHSPRLSQEVSRILSWK